jgi:hypothetical protein
MKSEIWVVVAAGLLVAACDTSAPVRAVTSDGEQFTGTAIATGAWDTSGTLNLVSNRGLTCVGQFVYDGIVGPTGKATFNCNNGEAGSAQLNGVTNGTGEGTIGSRKITFTWGRQAKS